jgi:hypothetical protein
MRRIFLLTILAVMSRAEDWRLTSDVHFVKLFEDFEPKQLSIAGVRTASIRTKNVFNDGQYGIRTYFFRISKEGCEWSVKEETWYNSDGKIAKSSTIEDSKLTWTPFLESNREIDKSMAERAIRFLNSHQ